MVQIRLGAPACPGGPLRRRFGARSRLREVRSATASAPANSACRQRENLGNERRPRADTSLSCRCGDQPRHTMPRGAPADTAQPDLSAADVRQSEMRAEHLLFDERAGKHPAHRREPVMKVRIGCGLARDKRDTVIGRPWKRGCFVGRGARVAASGRWRSEKSSAARHGPPTDAGNGAGPAVGSNPTGGASQLRRRSGC